MLQAFEFVWTFILIFFTSSLITSDVRNGVDFGQTQYYLTFESLISYTVITTVWSDYLSEFYKLIYHKCRNKRSKKAFPMERRQATFLAILMIVFLFGPGMPYLYFYGFVQYVFLYFADRILFVYYYRPVANHSNLMDTMFLTILKYAPILTGIMAICVQTKNAAIFSSDYSTDFRPFAIYFSSPNWWPTFATVLASFFGVFLLLALTFQFFVASRVTKYIKTEVAELEFM